MKVIIIGSGIAGMSAAIQAVELGMDAELLSPYVSERAQSVMAAGGINAAVDSLGEGDSPACHADDTLKGGCFLENEADLRYFCKQAPEHLRWLEQLGVVFSRDQHHNIALRAFGGQTHRRTAYAGASTGKQIVTALIQKCREYEISGKLIRRIGLFFHSALIRDGSCYGVLMTNALTGEIAEFYGDAVIMATGGQNKLFGKTTGTENCDGYAVGRLFAQGVLLRNLEFIQYHPTTMETSHKRMLISEAARGEGGRLYYLKNRERCYFMEEQYGPRGNLMPRDIVARCIYDCPTQVYLDVAFLGEKLIHERLQEIYELCQTYLGLDITKESIPVVPAVHFFMGGIAVNRFHETNIRQLYAVGECASKYHGANRLGGNSLLAAVHSGRTAAMRIHDSSAGKAAAEKPDTEAIRQLFADEIAGVRDELTHIRDSASRYPAAYILKDTAAVMNRNLGIVRCEAGLASGVESIDYYLDILKHLRFDPDVSVYENYRLYYMLLLAKAILLSARARKETRGAHIRTDYPDTLDAFRKCSFAEFSGDEIRITFREEADYEGQN